MPLSAARDNAPRLIRLNLSLAPEALLAQANLERLPEASASADARFQAGKAALEVLKREAKPVIALFSGLQ